MLRQFISFAVISLVQYCVLSVLITESWNCVPLYRCPDLLATFQKEEWLISLKEFLLSRSCSGPIFPPPRVICENPILDIQVPTFLEIALEEVNVTISPESESIWSLCDCGFSPNYKGTISRGNVAEEGMFPWMVQIYYTEYECVDSSCNSIKEGTNITLCGGSIITKSHILTAAHCVLKETRLGRELKVILLGTVKKEREHYAIKVSFVYAHPQYDAITFRNDVAILFLDEEIKMSDNVRPVCLHSGPIYHNTRLVSAGWGLTKYGNYSEDLLYIDDQVVWNREVCNKAFDTGITDEMFCTRGLSGSSVCHGDSGGPLVAITKPHPSCPPRSAPAASVWVALGVTSFGSSGCDAQKPVVFAHVVHFLPWIENTVKHARLSPNKLAELFSNFKPKQ